MKTSNLFNNLFDNIPKQLPDEIFQDIVKTDNVRIERIVSQGQSSPETGWYDQDENEWVLVMQGQAKLRFEKDNQLVELNPGDYIDIKAGVRHKVQSTDSSQQTIWLAVFYQD